MLSNEDNYYSHFSQNDLDYKMQKTGATMEEYKAFAAEQVQDFTPTPMTVSTVTWATGFHPYTMEPLFSAKNPAEKQNQRMFFFWYKPEERQKIIAELRRMNRPDLIDKLFGATFTPQTARHGQPKKHYPPKKR